MFHLSWIYSNFPFWTTLVYRQWFFAGLLRWGSDFLNERELLCRQLKLINMYWCYCSVYLWRPHVDLPFALVVSINLILCFVSTFFILSIVSRSFGRSTYARSSLLLVFLCACFICCQNTPLVEVPSLDPNWKIRASTKCGSNRMMPHV